MKTIVLLALISLSFALIPKELFTRKHFETTNNVTSDSFNKTQSNDLLGSSDNDTLVDDYGYFYSDESDWGYNNMTNSTDSIWGYNVTNSTDSIWNDNYTNSTDSIWGYNGTNSTDSIWNDNYTNSTFIPFNETDADIDNNTYFMIVLPLAGSLKNLTEELNTYLQSDVTDFDEEVLYKEMLESVASFFNETIEDNSSYDDILESIASLFNVTIEDEALYGLNGLFNITIESDMDSLNNTQPKNFRAVVLEVCLLPYNESGQIDIERYIVVAPESDESDWNGNITNSTNATWTDDVSTFIPLNETNSVFENEFDSESTKPLRPTFKTFTEELKNYLLSNETSAEAESLYDEMVEAIALLVNETLGEKGLYEFEQGENLFGL